MENFCYLFDLQSRILIVIYLLSTFDRLEGNECWEKERCSYQRAINQLAFGLVISMPSVV